MSDREPREIKLTDDLLDYAKRVAIKEARKRCPPHVIVEDVALEVLLKLNSKPPKYDPSKGASEKTLIYTVVLSLVLKYIARECQHAERFTTVAPREQRAGKDGRPTEIDKGVNKRVELLRKSTTTDNLLD